MCSLPELPLAEKQLAAADAVRPRVSPRVLPSVGGDDGDDAAAARRQEGRLVAAAVDDAATPVEARRHHENLFAQLLRRQAPHRAKLCRRACRDYAGMTAGARLRGEAQRCA
eukprot:2819392-Pleurochrysis_carterae.AAC.5